MDPGALLGGLDDEQRAAVTSPAMPLAVIAPAGSGKTRVLTARLAHRVATGEIEPGHVLCVTFTRKAAAELGTRLRALGLHDHIEAGTFHAVAWRQLRDRWASAGRPVPHLLDRVRPFLREQVAPDATPREIADLATEIAWARARLVSPADYQAAAAGAGRRIRRPASWVAERYAAYDAAKSRRHVVDFEDLLAACTRAIEGDAAFAAAQRWRFRHLFVDEFQDVNPLQFGLLEAWRGDRWDVFVVGDPHQSIYGWNGADPTLLDDLSTKWPALETITLARTHRSTPQVAAAAASVVRAAGLPDRSPVAVGAPGPPARLHDHDDEVAEVVTVATLVRRRRGPDAPWSAFAVLARTHDQVLDLERGLSATGVPVQLRRQAPLMDHAPVRRALHRLSLDDRPLLTALAEATGGHGVADDPLGELAAMAEQRMESEPGSTGRDFAGWVRSSVGSDPDDVDAVTLSTIHAAKGLEWPVVHVVGCEDGYLPHVTARRRAARDEEARLLYVAITRAAREVHLHWARTRTIRGVVRPRERSPFLDGFDGGADFAPSRDAGGAGRIDALRAVVGRSPRPGPDPLEVALREWRTRRATAARTAPEVVFDDRTLRALTDRRPSTLDDLADVPGIGAARARRFAPELIPLIERASEPVGGAG